MRQQDGGIRTVPGTGSGNNHYRQNWDHGSDNLDFKWNNYLSRYHKRHIDLMDVLAGYQMRASAKPAEVASMLGYPGKMAKLKASNCYRFY